MSLWSEAQDWNLINCINCSPDYQALSSWGLCCLVIKVIFGNKRHWTSASSLLLLVLLSCVSLEHKPEMQNYHERHLGATATPSCDTRSCQLCPVSLWDWRFWTLCFDTGLWHFSNWDCSGLGLVLDRAGMDLWECLCGVFSGNHCLVGHSLPTKQWYMRNKKGECPGQFLKPCFSWNNIFKTFDLEKCLLF